MEKAATMIQNFFRICANDRCAKISSVLKSTIFWDGLLKFTVEFDQIFTNFL